MSSFYSSIAHHQWSIAVHKRFEEWSQELWTRKLAQREARLSENTERKYCLFNCNGWWYLTEHIRLSQKDQYYKHLKKSISCFFLELDLRPKTKNFANLARIKLRFASVEFYGWEKEYLVFNKCLHRLVREDNNQRELVLIRDIRVQEEQLWHRPWLSRPKRWTECLSPGNSMAERQKVGRFKNLRDYVTKFKSELHLLVSIVPTLAEIIYIEWVGDVTGADKKQESKHQQLKYACRVFFRVVLWKLGQLCSERYNTIAQGQVDEAFDPVTAHLLHVCRSRGFARTRKCNGGPVQRCD